MKAITIKDRAFSALNLNTYNNLNFPDCVESLDLSIPKNKVYVLRMLIKKTFGEYLIPKEFKWIEPFINSAEEYNRKLNICQPFCYLTIRSTDVKSETVDEWHVDGFSTRITHLPEQNYIWTDHTPTEYLVRSFDIPDDFDPLNNNIHLLFQDMIYDSDKIFTCQPKTVYCFDPYVVHRAPQYIGRRTFIRLSYTPIEIDDCNNTINPLIKTDYIRDGIKEFRNNLTRYLFKT